MRRKIRNQMIAVVVTFGPLMIVPHVSNPLPCVMLSFAGVMLFVAAMLQDA